jgi:8-oxo-dGTP pyrophosphatase MutT (NUDIX family)
LTAETPLAALRRALAAREPRVVHLDGTPARAAVAIVCAPRVSDVELLFIERARREGDPWSGQMAFPGGFHDHGDPDLPATARRETLEELAVDLAEAAEPIGRLDDLQGVARGRELPLVISPFLYELRRPIEPRPNHEVQGTLWVPLSFLAEPANVGSIDWRAGGETARLPAYVYAERTIWGLTYRMVRNLLDLLGRG